MKKLVSIITLVCMLATVLATLAVPVSAAESYWYDSYTRGYADGTGVVSYKDGFVTFTSGVTTNDADLAQIWKQDASLVKPQMDVEFDLQILKHNGSQLMVFYNGQCRFYMHFNVDGLWGRGYSASAQYEAYNVPYDIGYEMHHYQLITDGNVGDMYIDGYYAGTITGETNANSPGRHEMLARTQKTGVSSWKFGNLKYNKYTGRKIDTGDDSGEPTESTYQAKQWEYVRMPVETDVHFDFETPEKYVNWIQRKTWEIKDGYASSFNKDDLKMWSCSGPFGLNPGQDFTITVKFRMDKFGEQQGIIPSWPNGSFRGYIYREYVEFETPYGMKRSNELHLEEGKWYEYTVAVTDNGTKNQLFIDGIPVTAVEPALDNNDHPYNGCIYFFTYPNGSMFSGLTIDWVDIKIVDDKIVINDPKKKAEFLDNKKIDLSATVVDSIKDEVPYVDYKINGQTIATGYAPDYKAEISGMNAGTYDIVAAYGDYVSPTREFKVIPGVKAEVQTSQDAYGNLFANLEFFERKPQIAKVEYRLNGKVVATSDQAPYYEMSMASLPPAQHTLEVSCYNDAGMIVYENEKKFTGIEHGNAPSENFANEVRYHVSGDFGNAEVNFSNGRHQLKMTHTRDGVTYLTDEGEKTYNYGLGNFIVVTDGPFAEVYRNGQMVFAFVMPMTQQLERNFVSGGLTIAGESIVPVHDRATYLSVSNVTDKQTVYNLGNLPNYHVMDAIVDVTDEGRLVVNDEYYRTDLQIKDGTVYTWTTKVEMMEPYSTVVGKLADWANADGKVYLRAETAVGMTRIYANGRWVFSCRSVPAIGKGTAAVEVKSGDGFEYVCVGDNKDVYYYEDDFSGDTQFETLTQWRDFSYPDQIGMAVSVEDGVMLLGAAGDKYSFMDVAAFGGDIDISADVKVAEGTDGFWFDFNRAVSHPYSRAGYNFETGEYEIVDVQPNNANTARVAVKGDFPTGEWVNMALKVRKVNDVKTEILYVNGEEVLRQENSPNYWRGKFGFLMKDGSAYVDNFKYRGDTKVIADARETFIDVNVDLIDLGGDEYILANTNAWRTTDGGKSFVQDKTVSVPSDNTVTLPNGDLIGLKSELQSTDADGKKYWNFIPYISRDKGKSWERYGTDKLAEEDHIGMTYNSMQNRIKLTPSGRLYAVCPTDVSTEWWSQIGVFYSDDYGLTWNDCETVVDNTTLATESHKTPGHTFVELVPLELANGDVYLFGRTNLGYIGYIRSYDGGKTFDINNTYTTPFLSTEMCYSVEVDLYNPEHVYAVFGYDNDNVNGKGQYPRTRWTFARSTDSMKTWEILGTVHENQGTIGAMMNTNIHITENQVLCNAFSREDSMDGGSWRGRTIALQKDAQVGSTRFEQLHLRQDKHAENTRTVYDYQFLKTLVLHPESGSAILNNNRVEEAAYGDGIAVEVAAGYISATVAAGEDGSVILNSLGNEFVFTKDQVIEHNGKLYINVNAYAEATGFHVVEDMGIKVVSPYESWSPLQMYTLRFSLDFFTDEL